MKTFIAENSKTVRQGLQLWLSALPGCRLVGWADNGVEATEQILRLRPEVVILDLHMPQRNGIEVLDEIRRQGVASTVIVFTNHGEPQFRQKCHTAGGNYFFDKSTEFDAFLALLEKLFRSAGPSTRNQVAKEVEA